MGKNFSEDDIILFYTLYVLINNKSIKLKKAKTPSFLIEDALSYFSEEEEFEKAAVIKNYFKRNEGRIIDMSWEDWHIKKILTGKI